MNYADWYTDTVDIWRVSAVKDGALTSHERQKLYSGIPCRVYKTDDKAIQMQQTAADVNNEMKLMCDNSVDIQTGDELLIHRGGRLGKEVAVIRAMAGSPNYYFEPFGAVIPGLAHQQIPLLNQERVS